MEGGQGRQEGGGREKGAGREQSKGGEGRERWRRTEGNGARDGGGGGGGSACTTYSPGSQHRQQG